MASLREMNFSGDSMSGKSNKELNIRTLVEGVETTAVCLVTKVTAGLTKIETGFFTFYVKDVNANVIAARMFDVGDYIKSGFIAKAFENKPVKITFIPQIFNGSWSLIVKEITSYKGDFDYESFRGVVKVNSAVVENKFELVFPDKLLNPDYYSISFSSVCNGKCGGFLKLINAVARDLENYDNIDGVTDKDKYLVFFYTVKAYFTLLKKKEEFEIVNQTDLCNVLLRIDQETQDFSMHSQIMDSCRAILGFGEPQHILSHVIYDSIMSENYRFALIEKNNSLAKGSTVKVNNKTLVNF